MKFPVICCNIYRSWYSIQMNICIKVKILLKIINKIIILIRKIIFNQCQSNSFKIPMFLNNNPEPAISIMHKPIGK